MSRRPQVANIKELVEHINRQLDAFSCNYQKLNLRQRVEKLVKIRHGSEDLGVSVLHDSIESQKSAKARIEAYLISNVGKKFMVMNWRLCLVSLSMGEEFGSFGLSMDTQSTPVPRQMTPLESI